MFKTVIIGVDGRPGGLDAIALARHLIAKDASVSLAYVYQDDSVPFRGDSGVFQATERERAHAVLETQRREAGIEAGLLTCGSPSVGRGLHELAEREHADLLVVGSSSRGLMGRVTASDDTRSALNGAVSAVAVAPAGYAERSVSLREIGVGYDGSPQSLQALEVAKELAAEHGAKVSAFQAVSLPSYAFAGGADAIAEALSSYVESARDEIAALGVEPHAAYGVPAEELALYGASVDLLVVGSRGYGPIGRIFHGSTSFQLVRSARCPLLVLTRA
jgi:nucleotide-binding universal stress UspA family protein